MKSILLIVLCGLVATGWSQSHKSDSAVLQGKWTGRETNARTQGLSTLIVTGKQLEFRGANTNEWYTGTFTLREDTDPKQLVATITDCPVPKYVGKTANAIYRLEDGKLTLTGNEPGNSEIPSSFDAPGSRKFVLKKSQ